MNAADATDSPAPRRIAALALAASLLVWARPVQAELVTPQILPGVAVGPVVLGMSETEGHAAAAAFERETGCEIDLQIEAGRVTAAGSRFGGCLEVTLPRGTTSYISAGPLHLPVFAGIGGSPDPFTAAFGEPTAVPLTDTMDALVWPNGLVARITSIPGGALITYLAIVPAGTTDPPLSFLLGSR